MNCCVDVAEVTWGNHNTLEISRILIETHKLNLMQKQQKNIKKKAIYTCNVNKNRLLFESLKLKHVINRFILHQKCFMRLGKPNVTVQVKLAKLASIPLGGPITLQISLNGHEYLCGCGWGDMRSSLHLAMHGCEKIGGLEALGGIKCTKSAQNWTKYPYSTLGQQKCPHSVNGTAPTMMKMHMWRVY